MDQLNQVASSFDGVVDMLPATLQEQVREKTKAAGLAPGVLPMVVFGGIGTCVAVLYGSTLLFVLLTMIYPMC